MCPSVMKYLIVYEIHLLIINVTINIEQFSRDMYCRNNGKNLCDINEFQLEPRRKVISIMHLNFEFPTAIYDPMLMRYQ